MKSLIEKVAKYFIKLTISFIIVFLIWGVLQLITIQLYRGKVDYGIQPWQQYNPSAKMKVLFAGDSTAVGIGATDNAMSTSGWFSKDFPDAHVENHSRSGLRLGGLIVILNDLQGKKFDIAILQIGANDIIRFTPFKKIENNLQQVLRLTRQIAKKIILLHSGDIGEVRIFLWPLNWIYTQRTLKMREIYRAASRNADISYVDIYAFNKKIKNIQQKYAKDNFHLNDQGYNMWYTYIKSKL